MEQKGLKGSEAESVLGKSNITCNKNAVPFDPEKPTVTSGIRLGTPACTTRGFGPLEFKKTGELICEVLNTLCSDKNGSGKEIEEKVKKEVILLCNQFPIYEDL